MVSLRILNVSKKQQQQQSSCSSSSSVNKSSFCLSSDAVKLSLTSSQRDDDDDDDDDSNDDVSTVASTTARSTSITSDSMIVDPAEEGSDEMILAASAAAAASSPTTTTTTTTTTTVVFPRGEQPQQQPQEERRVVRFGSLQIHEHSMILGGAGVPRMGGPPVSLSWERKSYHHIASVEEYDDLLQRLPSSGRRGEELLLTKEHRAALLTASGFTMREISEATLESDEIRIRRMALAAKMRRHTPGTSRPLQSILKGATFLRKALVVVGRRTTTTTTHPR